MSFYLLFPRNSFIHCSLFSLRANVKSYSLLFIGVSLKSYFVLYPRCELHFKHYKWYQFLSELLPNVCIMVSCNIWRKINHVFIPDEPTACKMSLPANLNIVWGLKCLKPLLAIFQLYRGGQLYWILNILWIKFNYILVGWWI